LMQQTSKDGFLNAKGKRTANLQRPKSSEVV